MFKLVLEKAEEPEIKLPTSAGHGKSKGVSESHLFLLLLHWRVYDSIANTSKRVLFLPSSDVYVRGFLYLLYTLTKLYYTKTLSDQASSLAPD